MFCCFLTYRNEKQFNDKTDGRFKCVPDANLVWLASSQVGVRAPPSVKQAHEFMVAECITKRYIVCNVDWQSSLGRLVQISVFCFIQSAVR